jgi:hypothetical protein
MRMARWGRRGCMWLRRDGMMMVAQGSDTLIQTALFGAMGTGDCFNSRQRDFSEEDYAPGLV